MVYRLDRAGGDALLLLTCAFPLCVSPARALSTVQSPGGMLGKRPPGLCAHALLGTFCQQESYRLYSHRNPCCGNGGIEKHVSRTVRTFLERWAGRSVPLPFMQPWLETPIAATVLAVDILLLLSDKHPDQPDHREDSHHTCPSDRPREARTVDMLGCRRGIGGLRTGTDIRCGSRWSPTHRRSWGNRDSGSLGRPRRRSSPNGRTPSSGRCRISGAGPPRRFPRAPGSGRERWRRGPRAVGVEGGVS